MRPADLRGKNVVIWGAGREGLAAAKLLQERLGPGSFTLIDEQDRPPVMIDGCEIPIVSEKEFFLAALAKADVLVKSPGVSLYHPLIEKERARGLCVTSLLNLWRAENPKAVLIGVTGTKGKSTTATLLGHVLNALSRRTLVLGNIGRPVSEAREGDADVFILEMSSYQTATFDGRCRLAVMTSLFPEHLNWHGGVKKYYADKARLLAQADFVLIAPQARAVLQKEGIPFPPAGSFGEGASWHFEARCVFYGREKIGVLGNEFLLRAHNQSNVCAVLSAVDALGLDTRAALCAMETYQGLPHRQKIIGEKDGLTFVDDSISTTPQSALAALTTFGARPIGLLIGGFDRGVDYAPLIDALARGRAACVVCLGQNGPRLFDELRKRGVEKIFQAATMGEAVALAAAHTPPGGIVLLSPAAPSFDMYKDYVARAEAFAAAAQIALA